MNMFRIGEGLSRVVRRPRACLAVAIPIAFPLLLASVTNDNASPMSLPTPPLRYDRLQAPEAPLPSHSLLLPLERGDTLESVFAVGGLTTDESRGLSHVIAQQIDPRRILPGTVVRFHHTDDRIIDSVTVRIGGWGEVTALRDGDRFSVASHEAPRTEVETTVAATVQTSLYEALISAGEGPQLAQQIVDIFRWDIDFFELDRGDTFSLVVKKRFVGKELAGYGPILAARFVHDGVTYEAFRSEWNGTAGYYARSGQPLRKQFLRAPLQFTRITSRFTKSRFHPILQLFRPHHGVDYGAPTGTPVMTTADGVVVETDYNRGEGNYVRIQHNSRIETFYLHLSRFAKGIRPGRRVQQGDVIGYVGMTGLATGPHLDYRVRDGSNWLDPLKLKSITPDPLRADALHAFRADVGRFAPRLSTPEGRVAGTRISRASVLQ